MRITVTHCKQLLRAIDQAQAFCCNTDNCDAMYRNLLDSLVDLTASEYGTIGRVYWQENGQPYAKIRAISGRSSNEQSVAIQHDQGDRGLKNCNLDKLIGEVIGRAKPVIANQGAQFPGDAGLPPGHPALKTFMGLPILVSGTVVGVVGLANRKQGYDEDLAEFLRPLLNTCGIVINASAIDVEWLGMQSKLEAQPSRLELLVTERTTDLVDREEKLRAHDAYLQNILSSSPNAILVSDLDSGLVKFANQRTLDMFELSEFNQKVAAGAVYWVDQTEREQMLAQIRRNGRASGEVLMKTAQGRILHITLTAQSTPDNPSEAIWWLGDMTARKEMQHELHQQRLMLERIVEYLPVALWVKDINNEFRHTVFNKEAEKLFSIPAEMVLQKTEFDFMDPETARQIREEDLEIVRSGQIFDVPNDRIEAMTGDIRYGHRVKVVVPDVYGKPSLILGLCDDLTEQRYAEQSLRASETRFRDLAEHAPVGIFLTDPRGACVFVNKTWRKMTGLDQEQSAGAGWMTALHEEDRANVDRAWNRFVDGAAEFSLQYRLVRPGGQVTWVKATAISLKNEDSQVTGFLRTTTDITEQKQFTAELERSRDQAQHANAAKSEFLSRMSHELRTPLNAVLGFGQLLQMNNSNLTQSQNDSIGYILAGGEHLLSLIEDVLDFSRIESGRMRLRFKALSSHSILQRSISMVQPLAQQREITIHCSDHKVADVLADKHRLQQILINLLTNAIKYNRPGGAVEVDTTMLPGNFVRYCITDNGIGIHPEDQPRLFEPFERGRNSSTMIEGTGIGLSICKRLVDSMGGQIGFESEYGTGSMFWFYLPAVGNAADA